MLDYSNRIVYNRNWLNQAHFAELLLDKPETRARYHMEYYKKLFAFVLNVYLSHYELNSVSVSKVAARSRLLL